MDYTIITPALLVAAEAGDALAQYNLGWMYANGFSVPKDFASSVKWFRKDSALGDDLAKGCIGLTDDKGRGVPVDLKRLSDWIVQAAKRGNMYAQ